jgi:hypothetical protein
MAKVNAAKLSSLHYLLGRAELLRQTRVSIQKKSLHIPQRAEHHGCTAIGVFRILPKSPVHALSKGRHWR